MLYQCWASVVDGGPTMVQHRVDFSCLLGGTEFTFLPESQHQQITPPPSQTWRRARKETLTLSHHFLLYISKQKLRNYLESFSTLQEGPTFDDIRLSQNVTNTYL